MMSGRLIPAALTLIKTSESVIFGLIALSITSKTSGPPKFFKLIAFISLEEATKDFLVASFVIVLLY